MGLYIRAYPDYCYEIIYTDGTLKKKRIHILINPGDEAKLQGQKSKSDTEINVKSLTHIVAMETSIMDSDVIDRTKKIAQITNKPIITNSESAEKFKEKGLSVKQLRVLGFEEEVIDGLSVDPIYLEEIDGTFEEQTQPEEEEEKEPFSVKRIPKMVFEVGKQVPRLLNPINWRPVRAVKDTITGDSKINPKNPLALRITFNNKSDVIVPLDKRAQENINQIIPGMKPHLVILPHNDVSHTTDITSKVRTLLIVNQMHKGEKALVIPKTYNTSTDHDTIYASFSEWIDVDELLK